MASSILSNHNFIKEVACTSEEVINLVNKDLLRIRKELLNTEKEVSIKEVECFIEENKAIVTFINDEKVIFKAESLEDDKIINDFIKWLNKKMPREKRLYARKIINCDEYSFSDFIISQECKTEVELLNYYYKAGELLVILYILNCNNFKSNNVISMLEYPVLQDIEGLFYFSERKVNQCISSRDIARDILNYSVYNIEFLPESKKNLQKSHIEAIKSGFNYMYNIIVNNKLEVIDRVNEIFNKKQLFLAKVITKLYGLNDVDLRRQLYFLDARFLKNEDEKTFISFSNKNTNYNIDKDYLLKLACKLGDHIMERSIIGFRNFKISRTWISSICDSRFEEESHLSPEGYSLYEGNSGIALFFLYLGVVTAKDYFVNAAIEAMQDSIENISNLNEDKRVLTGAFKGIAGELYTLSKIYSLTKEESIKEVIQNSIYSLRKLIKVDKSTNVIEGTSSVIAVLLSMYDDAEFDGFKAQLLDLANLAYNNITCNLELENSIVGFGYGNDGVIAFLARLLAISGNKEIQNTIKEILYFQRRAIIKADNNVVHGWGEGYPGMLLSRLILKESGYEDDLIDKEIEEALEYTIERGFGNSSYYCNGDIGNLDILEFAAEVLKDKSLKNRCINTFNEVVNSVIEPAINKEIRFGNKHLSLMSGLVGHGYSLVRRINEYLVPQVLWLQ